LVSWNPAILDVAGLPLVELSQALEIELGEGRGGRLLQAPVRVLDQEVEPFLEIERRQRRGLHDDRIGRLETEGHDRLAGAGPGRDLQARRLGDGRVAR
jgi:hypothetical protein